MKKIKLGYNQKNRRYKYPLMYALVDDEDYDWLTQWKWHANWEKQIKSFRAIRRYSSKKNVYMSRVIMNAPKGKLVDHINHNTLDNRKSNLRLCTPQQNQMNRRKSSNNKSGFNGVYWKSNQKTWQAMIGFNNKRLFLGNFKCKKEAAKAYNKAAKKYYGEYAYQNSIS